MNTCHQVQGDEDETSIIKRDLIAMKHGTCDRVVLHIEAMEAEIAKAKAETLEAVLELVEMKKLGDRYRLMRKVALMTDEEEIKISDKVKALTDFTEAGFDAWMDANILAIGFDANEPI